MIGTLILRLLIPVVFLFFFCVFVISALNRRSARTDSNMYDPQFNPSGNLTAYKTKESIIEMESDPEAMERYRISDKKKG
jgi:hypothetical protein